MTLQFLSSKRVEGLDAEKDTIPVNALESGYSFTALDTPQEYIWNGVDTWVPIGGSSLAQQPWIEIARTTLTVQGQSLLISNMPNMMYYMVLHRGIRVSGSFNPKMSFNGDIAGNYSARGNTNFGADFTAPSATLGMGQGISDANSYFQYSTILNRQNFQKMAQIHAVTQEGVGAAIVPRSGIEFDKWVDTTQPIFNLEISNAHDSGIWAVGSEIVLLGYTPNETVTTPFWEELATADLSGGNNAVLSTGTFTPKRYLWVQFAAKVLSGGAATSITFNGDNGTNYGVTRQINGGTPTDTPSETGITDGLGVGDIRLINMYIVNDANEEKLAYIHQVAVDVAGASPPPRVNYVGKWDNIINQINEVSLTSSAQPWTTVSKVTVWGSD